VAEVGTLTVPFGAEPAAAVLAFVEQALDARPGMLDGGAVAMLMGRVCAAVPCAVAIDTRPQNFTVSLKHG
jgi:hypothetical protein